MAITSFKTGSKLIRGAYRGIELTNSGLRIDSIGPLDHRGRREARARVAMLNAGRGGRGVECGRRGGSTFTRLHETHTHTGDCKM